MYENFSKTRRSHLARGVWVEIEDMVPVKIDIVTSRKGCMSWKIQELPLMQCLPCHTSQGVCELKYLSRRLPERGTVTSRKRCVSWNSHGITPNNGVHVTPRKRCMSWNLPRRRSLPLPNHASQEVCELKLDYNRSEAARERHTSQGVCELKSIVSMPLSSCDVTSRNKYVSWNR